MLATTLKSPQSRRFFNESVIHVRHLDLSNGAGGRFQE